MRTIECDICGEPITGNDDEELVGRLKDHLTEEHDADPGRRRGPADDRPRGV